MWSRTKTTAQEWEEEKKRKEREQAEQAASEATSDSPSLFSKLKERLRGPSASEAATNFAKKLKK